LITADINLASLNTRNEQRDGNLTLKGVTKPISLHLEFNGVSAGQGEGEVGGFEASVGLNRKDFGISIDLPMETGGAVVGDTVTVTLNIEAVKQS
jgi:polyisoprenoid-binding protein YceI